MKEKIKIMKTRPVVTEEEIKSFMDFDALLDQKDKLAIKQRNIRRLRDLFIGLTCLLAVPSFILLLSERPTKEQPLAVSIEPPPSSASAIVDTMQRTQPVEQVQPSLAPSKNEKPTSIRENIAEEREDEAVKDYTVLQQPVYVQAEPMDGYPTLYEYFDKNLKYPASVAKEPIEGVVDVSFTIDTTGKAIRITVENSLGEMFDQEIMRLMEEMPPWRPASYNGKPVHSKISLPITFSAKKTVNP